MSEVDYGLTWDHIPITPGLIVFTNEMRAGKVVEGLREHNPGWFDVEYRDGGKVTQSADRVTTHFNGQSAARTHRVGHDWTFSGGQRKCALCEITEKNNDPCPRAQEGAAA